MKLSEKIECAPGVLPYLERIRRHVKKGALPRSIRLGKEPDDAAVRRLLAEVTSGCCRRLDDGTLELRLAGETTQLAYWREVVEALDAISPLHEKASAGENAGDAFKRLKILFPEERNLLARLETNEAVRRFLEKHGCSEYAVLIRLMQKVDTSSEITLSQLGADFFHDSKVLRDGPLLAQLITLLREKNDWPEERTDRAVLESCGISENPYTSCVTFFLPLRFRLAGGEVFDFPERLFKIGQAVQLPWETVRRIERVELDGKGIITSENAAPFYQLVQHGTPAVYTEGYPNAAVKRLLAKLGETGVKAIHAGDSDLDGYRIAMQTGKAIPLERLAWSKKDRDLVPRRPLTDKQKKRLENFILSHPDFPYAEELRETLLLGWIEQESMPLASWGEPERS